ncbi:hypothetical protein AB0V79_26770 [Mesorhizobium ciceri]|uniref:hypothetical protein n=1 Tax=Mesorhizobium ciceri TaxID=39645 RepID=UPI001FCE0690|nr:hypothetical protein [Mesorhizobium ciceri]
MTGGYLLAGVWALAILAVFIQAIRLSYRIEARSPDLTNRSGFPRKAMMFSTPSPTWTSRGTRKRRACVGV